MRIRRSIPTVLLLPIALFACTRQPRPAPAPAPVAASEPPLAHAIIPLPRSVTLDTTRSFTFDTLTVIAVDAGIDSTGMRVANYLTTMLSPVVRPDVRRA